MPFIRACGLLAAMFVMSPIVAATAAPPEDTRTSRGSAPGGEILEVAVKPNPIVIKGSQLGASDIEVTGHGTCDHVVIYIKLPDEPPPPPSAGAWSAEKKGVVFSGSPAKTGTVGFGNVSFTQLGTYDRVVWAYPAPDSKNCKGRARTVVRVNKSL